MNTDHASPAFVPRPKSPRSSKYRFEPGSETPESIYCPGCEQFVAFADYSKNQYRSFGLATYCSKCRLAYDRARYDRERSTKFREGHLRRTYGITQADYDKMLTDQGGGCAICRGGDSGVTSKGASMAFAVDHCHTTGKVRGLLCKSCNTGLGYFRDDHTRLASAIEYLADAKH